MQCVKCNESKPKKDLHYDQKTLELYCSECISPADETVPYYDIDDYLKENIPEVYTRKTKAVSSRLDLAALIYLMKYAQENGISNISSVINEMVNEMRKLKSLNDVELIEYPFDGKPKRKVGSPFLQPKRVRKEEITIDQPEKVENDEGDILTL